ncbi:MAG TPA: DUF222 domain-containing protein [Actinomycetota bacterium]|jgi:hypothetical protein|nr:DUF222 domain-containing protein [Actinomycetota bacterium]
MFEDATHPLTAALDSATADVGRAQRRMLRLIADADRREVWRDAGARDTAHWLTIRYGISEWKARRWVGAAHALEDLPLIAEALEQGALGIDKVAELTRFATPETEARLIRWAATVSVGAVRHRGDLEATASIKDVRQTELSREVTWWYHDEGRRFGLEADLPAASGPVIVNALEREADRIAVLPGEEDEVYASARRADALVALCSARIGSDPEPDRATVVVHARLDGLQRDTGGCEIEGGPVIHPQTVRRLLCNARVQTVVEDRDGNVLGIGRVSREPPQWMLRQVRHRDRECRFPGCGARRFTEAHHLRWWRHGGRTDLANLALVCSFHHRLVHEHGWSARRESTGDLLWRRPDGTRYESGPSPGTTKVFERAV